MKFRKNPPSWENPWVLSEKPSITTTEQEEEEDEEEEEEEDEEEEEEEEEEEYTKNRITPEPLTSENRVISQNFG